MEVQAPRPIPTPDIRFLNVQPGHHGFGVVENVAIQVWRGQAREQDTRFMMDVGAQLVGYYERGFTSVQVVKPGTGLPEPAARAAFVTLLREYGPKLGDIVVVLEGQGFWASAIQGLITSLRLATGNRVGFRSFSNMEEAAHWLPLPHQQRTGVAVSGAQLVAVVAHLSQQAAADGGA